MTTTNQITSKTIFAHLRRSIKRELNAPGMKGNRMPFETGYRCAMRDVLTEIKNIETGYAEDE